jgi:hypothetical protein
MNGSASAPSSATPNGTRWAIRSAMKATSRESRSSLATSWGRLRYPFKISEAMLARLTPERPTIIDPQPQSLVPPGPAA